MAIEKREWEPSRWEFRVDEIANLCWEVVADDNQGTIIRRVEYGPGTEDLLQQVKDEAAEITRRWRAAAAGATRGGLRALRADRG